MIKRCDLVAVLICIFYYCNAHLVIFTCNLRTISTKLLLLLLYIIKPVNVSRKKVRMGALADLNLAATQTIRVTKTKGDEQGGTRGSKPERRATHELRQVY